MFWLLNQWGLQNWTFSTKLLWHGTTSEFRFSDIDLLGLLHDKTEQGWKVYKNSRDPERFTWCLWLYMGESMTLEVMTLETWLKIHTNDCKLWQPPQKPYKLLIFFTISVIFMGKHSDFRISSFQVVSAWRILQFNWKNEIYLEGFIWFFRLHEEFRMIIFHGNRSW